MSKRYHKRRRELRRKRIEAGLMIGPYRHLYYTDFWRNYLNICKEEDKARDLAVINTALSETGIW